jgi:toxin CptA
LRRATAWAVAVATVLLVVAFNFPWWVTSAAIAWCVGALAIDERRARSQTPASLLVSTDRQITVLDSDGVVQRGTVLDGTYVTAFLTTVVWCPVDAHWARHVVVLPDSMRAEDRRRLRVWLRFAHPADPKAVDVDGADLPNAA